MSSTSTTETGCVWGPPEATSFPLLDLPREIRERIYIAVLRTSASPPSFPVSMADRVSAETLRAQDCGGDVKYPTMYPRVPLPINISTLLTLNRQVNAEVKEAIPRKETTRLLTYKLDCMVVDYKQLYATWLSVPALSSSVDVVEANFRVFGDVKGGPSSGSWGWRDGSIGPYPFHGRLLDLLRRFLKSGPDFLSPPKSSGVKIGELVLNVVTQEEPSDGFILVEQHYDGFLGIKRLIPPEKVGPNTPDKVLREELVREIEIVRTVVRANAPDKVLREVELVREIEVVRELEGGMRRLWHSSERNVLQESVGVVRICLDGQAMYTWNLKGRGDHHNHQLCPYSDFSIWLACF